MCGFHFGEFVLSRWRFFFPFVYTSINSTLFDVCWMNIGFVVTVSATILSRLCFGSNWKSIESDVCFCCRLERMRFNQMLFYTQFTCITRKHWPFDLPVALFDDDYYFFTLIIGITFWIPVSVFLCQVFNFKSIDLLRIQLTGIVCFSMHSLCLFCWVWWSFEFRSVQKVTTTWLLRLADSCLFFDFAGGDFAVVSLFLSFFLSVFLCVSPKWYLVLFCRRPNKNAFVYKWLFFFYFILLCFMYICNKAALLMRSTCQNKPGQYLIWFGCYCIVITEHISLYLRVWLFSLTRSVYMSVSVFVFSFLFYVLFFVCQDREFLSKKKMFFIRSVIKKKEKKEKKLVGFNVLTHLLALFFFLQWFHSLNKTKQRVDGVNKLNEKISFK